MKSRKSVFKIEDGIAGHFVSLTHYSRKDKRLYKGQRSPFDIVGYQTTTGSVDHFIEAQILIGGLMQIEIQIDRKTNEFLNRVFPFKIYLTKCRASMLEHDSYKWGTFV